MRREKLEIIFAVALFGLGVFLGARFLTGLWNLNASGLSAMSARLPYWDFTNLWAGTKLALTGRVAVLFDADGYRLAIRSLLSPLMMDQEWSYPPSMLLVGIPFAMMPIFTAYWVWTVATLALLFVAARYLRFSIVMALLITICPAACIDMVFGQNGALTTSLLMLGLLLVPSRPILGGILLGLLTIKPQIGLLVPICLLAGGHYRAILSACMMAILLVAVSGLAFGSDVWLLFWTKTRPLMAAILEAPFPQGYQANAMTAFIAARAMGFGLTLSYAFQAIFSALAALIVIALWSGFVRIRHVERVCLSALLSLVAMPYGYVHDAIPLDIAAAYCFQRRTGGLPIIGLAWIYPAFNHQVATRLLLPIGVVVPLLLAIWMLYQVWREQSSFEEREMTLKASAAPPARRDDSAPSAGSDQHEAGSAGCSGAGSSG